MKESRKLERPDEFFWGKLNYEWVHLEERQLKVLEPVIEGFETVGKNYSFLDDDYIATASLYNLEKGKKHLAIIAVFSPLVLKVGENCKEFSELYVPLFISKYEIESDSIEAHELRKLVNPSCKMKIDFASFIKESNTTVSLPWNYQFLKSAITEIKAQEFYPAYYDHTINGIQTPLEQQVCKTGYMEADIRLYMNLTKIRDALGNNVRIRTFLIRKNCIEIQIRELVDEERLFENTIFSRLARRGKSFYEGTRLEIMFEEDTVVFMPKETSIIDLHCAYDTSMRVTTNLTLIIKPDEIQEEVQIYHIELPEHYVIGETLHALRTLDIEKEIPSNEDLTD